MNTSLVNSQTSSNDKIKINTCLKQGNQLKREGQHNEAIEQYKQALQLQYEGINYTPRNVGHYPKDIDPDLLSRLQEFYRPHNQKLEELLGRKFNLD